MSLIDVRDLARTFVVRKRARAAAIGGRTRTEVQAVHDLTFEIEAGEMIGYIGPNGAGKSTTIKMLTGILVPTSGHLRVAGLEPSRERTRLARRIGVVFGQRTTLWWDLPLRDSFELLQKIYRVDPARHRRTLEEYVELLDLGDLLDTPVRQLSLGQRMRGDITAALLHDPEILYLDEPTIGLDVISKGRLREFLRTLNAERGHHPHAHHPRPAGHRGALRPGDRHRPRDGGLRRSRSTSCTAAASPSGPSWSTWSTRPRRSRSRAR